MKTVAGCDVVHDVISIHESTLVYKALLTYFYTGKLWIVFSQSDVMRHFDNNKTSHTMTKIKSPLNRTRLIILTNLILLGFLTSANAQDTLRILFIGNSMTYVQDLPGLLTNLASSNGKTIITAQNTPGGYYLDDH
ncbi:MAG: hypothetical protein ACK5IO_07500, partial [Bacteroidota bacterium]